MKRLSALLLILILLLSACGGSQVETVSDGSVISEEAAEVIETPFDATPVEPDYPLVNEPTELRLLFPLQGEEINQGMEALFSAFEIQPG